MGDMADFANDDRMDEVINLHEHRDRGFPTDQQAHDDGFVDGLGYETFTDDDFNIPAGGHFAPVVLKKSKFTSCKYCGFVKLVWKETNDGWRLTHPDGELHACEERMEATAWTVD